MSDDGYAFLRRKQFYSQMKRRLSMMFVEIRSRARATLARARESRPNPESAPPRIMRPRRVARAALALALVSALASLGVARGERSASTVGAGGSRSDEATRASPSPGPHQGAPLPPFPTEADTAFAAWLASKGGAFTGAGVWSYVETGHATGDPSIVTGRNRGVFAKDAPVENGDVLVEMRLDAALTVPSERAGSILNAVARQVDPEWALAMLLLRESNLGPSGPYAPFLRMALGVESDAATRPEGATDALATGSLATDDVRATALTNDAVAALNGTFAGRTTTRWYGRTSDVFARPRDDGGNVPGGVSRTSLRRFLARRQSVGDGSRKGRAVPGGVSRFPNVRDRRGTRADRARLAARPARRRAVRRRRRGRSIARRFGPKNVFKTRRARRGGRAGGRTPVQPRRGVSSCD